MSGVDPNKVIRILAMKLANKEIELAFEQAKQDLFAEADASASPSGAGNESA